MQKLKIETVQEWREVDKRQHIVHMITINNNRLVFLYVDQYQIKISFDIQH